MYDSLDTKYQKILKLKQEFIDLKKEYKCEAIIKVKPSSYLS